MRAGDRLVDGVRASKVVGIDDQTAARISVPPVSCRVFT
jgi:hypothetical protein